jgi:hypothetical protein
MAALLGFDGFTTSASVITPITLGAVLASVALPAKATVGGIDVDVGDLDANATPLIRLDVGDVADADRFVAASTIARDGGLLEYRPESAAYYRYPLASAVRVTVQTAPATGVAGTIGVTVYGYPSADISDAVRLTLQGLGVLAEGQTARAEDDVLAREALAEVHQMLRYKGLANRQDLEWPTTAIPLFAVRSYARMAGNLLADVFGLPAQRHAVLAQRAAEAEREIRRQTYVKYDGSPVNLEPYRDDPPYFLERGVLA